MPSPYRAKKSKFTFHPDELSWSFVPNQIPLIVLDLAEQGLVRNVDYKLQSIHDYSGKFESENYNHIGTVFYIESLAIRSYVAMKYA